MIFDEIDENLLRNKYNLVMNNVSLHPGEMQKFQSLMWLLTLKTVNDLIEELKEQRAAKSYK